MNRMINVVGLKNLLSKLTATGLILLGLQSLFLSLYDLFFLFPRGLPLDQTNLIHKAIILTATMMIDTVFGLILFLKSKEEVKIGHLFAGLCLLLISIFFKK